MTRVSQDMDIVVEDIEEKEIENTRDGNRSRNEGYTRKSRTITESLKPDLIMNAKTNIYTAQTKAQFFETISNIDFQDDENFSRALSTMPRQHLSNFKKEPPKSIKTETQVLLHTPETNSILIEKKTLNSKEVSEKIQHTYDELKAMFDNLKHMAEFKVAKLRNITVPPFDEELAEFREVRKLEYLLGVALADYDMILESETWINEEKLRQHYENQLDSLAKKHQKELEELRKKKIDHLKCDKQIVELSNKNDQLVDELSTMEKENAKMKEQLRLLQVNSSNQQEEFNLLMTKYKQLQIQTKTNLFNNHIGPVKDAEEQELNKHLQLLSEQHERKPAWNKYKQKQNIPIVKSVFYEPVEVEPTKQKHVFTKRREKKTISQRLEDGIRELVCASRLCKVDEQLERVIGKLEGIITETHAVPKRHVKDIDRLNINDFKSHF
ncbi:hypothetical protein HK103_000846 [Boothiomyces macroporosus]|uniref:Uncharacterized protein n=1 Tax=Boothiomyces macroporosus TaxID=261099 RepID=A0AAD5UBZ2_9FUNG|nr:hypothetical protein HK103_000846 [Boothiomyces macroporosus]